MVDNISNRLWDFDALPYKHWKKLGLAYYAEEEMEYLTNELLSISEVEVGRYKDACKELYSMYEKAAQMVIDNDLWDSLGIPENAIDIIRYSWNKRNRLLHLYGRFDIAGIINGHQAKLIEFNADTATIMPETATIQKEQFKKAKIKGASQFNNLAPLLTERFLQAKDVNRGKGQKMLLSDLGHKEDILNLDILTEAAKKAGFDAQQMVLEHVHFSAEEGIFLELNEEEFIKFDYWVKLIPWEFIAYEEPELMDILTQIVEKDLCVILNPAYTMLFQSKAIMKLLWDIYPNHPLLLKTSFRESDFKGKPYVKKVIFGREGENIQVIDKNGRELEENDGDFGDYPSIYQEFVELPEDRDGDIYQAGVYYTNKATALSYRRRDGLIIDEDSEFIGHYVI